jgi:hypothetical protein
MNELAVLFVKNLGEMTAAAFVPTIKATHGMQHHGVMMKVMSKLDTKDHALVAKYKIWNLLPAIQKLNEEMKNKDFIGKEIKTIFGHQMRIELTKNKPYSTYFKPIRKLAADVVDEVYLRKMAQKSMKLMELTYLYIFATLTNNSKLISYDLPKEDREFMNAFAESCCETLHYMIFPADDCPSINDYLTTRNVEEWDKMCIVTPEVFSAYQSVIQGFLNRVCPDGNFRVVKSGEKKSSSSSIHFDRKCGENNLYSPIEFTEKLTKPFTFILGGDSSMDNKELPEATRKYWENHIATPEIKAVVDEAEAKKKRIATTTVVEKVVPKELDKPLYNQLADLIANKYKNAPVDYNNPDAKEMVGLELKDKNGILFVDIKKKDGTTVSNIVDSGRYAGGRRFSVIGTALLPNNPENRYPQFVDIDKHPDVALKILLDDRYHLTEEERIRTKERFATPIVYEWFDFVDTEFINDLNDTDLKQFFYNCFNIIVSIESNHNFQIAGRLRITDFVDTNNFTVVSDENCKSEYAQFGIKQNKTIIEGLRMEVRNGAILDNSTKIVNVPNPVKDTPFTTIPENPIQMFNQIQSFTPVEPVNSGFMPAKTVPEIGPQAVGKVEDGSTVLSDGSFIPNFGNASPFRQQVQQTPPIDLAKFGLSENMTYEEFKNFMNGSPVSQELKGEIGKRFPLFEAEYLKETFKK